MDRTCITYLMLLLFVCGTIAGTISRISKREVQESSGSGNGNANVGSGNGNNNGNCFGNCADNASGNGNGNANNGDANGNDNGNCVGNCVGNESGNSNGNANTNSNNNGNSNGNCEGNCFHNMDGNANGNANTNTDGNGNDNGNCVGNCFDRLEGNAIGNENQAADAVATDNTCFGNCFGGQPTGKTAEYDPTFPIERSPFTCVSSDDFTYYIRPGTYCIEAYRTYNKGGQHAAMSKWECPKGTVFDLDICRCNHWYLVKVRTTCRSGWYEWAYSG